ncbi:MAG: hypothetical protein LBB14_00130 [Puniceicoccales bacterium]|nr:hypothetical protein [Puniceicoccales bacterium]
MLLFGGVNYAELLVEKYSKGSLATGVLLLQNIDSALVVLEADGRFVALFVVLSLLSGGLLAVAALVAWLVVRRERLATIEAWDPASGKDFDDPFLNGVFAMVKAAEKHELTHPASAGGSGAQGASADMITFPAMSEGLKKDFTEIGFRGGGKNFVSNIFQTKIREYLNVLKICDGEFPYTYDRGEVYSFKRVVADVLQNVLDSNERGNIYEDSLCNDGNVAAALARLSGWCGLDGTSNPALAFNGSPPTQLEWNSSLLAIEKEAKKFRKEIVLGAMSDFPKKEEEVTEQDREKFVRKVRAYLATYA